MVNKVNNSTGGTSPRGRVRRVKPPSATPGKLRAVPLGSGLPALPELVDELAEYTDVLLGRVDPPHDAGTLTLLETADAYHARASEITMLLQELERTGQVLKGSAHYRFRTGELRTFLDVAKRAADLGSRRLTYERLQFEREMLGRGSV